MTDQHAMENAQVKGDQVTPGTEGSAKDPAVEDNAHMTNDGLPGSHSALFGLGTGKGPSKSAGSGAGSGIIGTSGHRGSRAAGGSTITGDGTHHLESKPDPPAQSDDSKVNQTANPSTRSDDTTINQTPDSSTRSDDTMVDRSQGSSARPDNSKVDQTQDLSTPSDNTAVNQAQDPVTQSEEGSANKQPTMLEKLNPFK